jgi:hypothetical protein
MYTSMKKPVGNPRTWKPFYIPDLRPGAVGNDRACVSRFIDILDHPPRSIQSAFAQVELTTLSDDCTSISEDYWRRIRFGTGEHAALPERAVDGPSKEDGQGLANATNVVCPGGALPVSDHAMRLSPN